MPTKHHKSKRAAKAGQSAVRAMSVATATTANKAVAAIAKNLLSATRKAARRRAQKHLQTSVLTAMPRATSMHVQTLPRRAKAATPVDVATVADVVLAKTMLTVEPMANLKRN